VSLNWRHTTALCAVRGLWGLALLLAPDPLASAVGGVSCDRRLRAIIRVLGAREVTQAYAISLRPRRSVLLAGAAVDATHGASMILLAVREARLRRLAAASATAAMLFGAATAREARQATH
jgi:hypothetical protein